jgi:glycerol kinase
MAKYAAALDQGTTSTRCMIFNHSGEVVSVAQKEHEQI